MIQRCNIFVPKQIDRIILWIVYPAAVILLCFIISYFTGREKSSAVFAPMTTNVAMIELGISVLVLNGRKKKNEIFTDYLFSSRIGHQLLLSALRMEKVRRLYQYGITILSPIVIYPKVYAWADVMVMIGTVFLVAAITEIFIFRMLSMKIIGENKIIFGAVLISVIQGQLQLVLLKFIESEWLILIFSVFFYGMWMIYLDVEERKRWKEIDE